jgi:hypothetical protein
MGQLRAVFTGGSVRDSTVAASRGRFQDEDIVLSRTGRMWEKRIGAAAEPGHGHASEIRI